MLEVAAECGYLNPIGGELVGDWERESAEEIAADVLACAAPGSIIILHDGRPPRDSSSRLDRVPTVAAVEIVVPALCARGFALMTVSEL